MTRPNFLLIGARAHPPPRARGEADRHPAHPAESVYSGFLMTRKNGRKPLSDFARALEAEEGRVKDDWWIGRYKRKGFYHAELSLYYGLFGPEQIRVYLHEDLEEDPSGVVRNSHGFLSVDDSFCPDVSLRYNKSGFPKSGTLCKVFQRPHPIKSGLKRLLPKGFRRRTHMRLQNKVLVKPTFLYGGSARAEGCLQGGHPNAPFLKDSTQTFVADVTAVWEGDPTPTVSLCDSVVGWRLLSHEASDFVRWSRRGAKEPWPFTAGRTSGYSPAFGGGALSSRPSPGTVLGD